MSQGDHLSELEFIKKSIKQLRELPERGIHTKYSGFEGAFKKYFDKNPFVPLPVKFPVKNLLPGAKVKFSFSNCYGDSPAHYLPF